MKPETIRPPARVPAPAELPSRGPWSLADIDYAAMDRPLVAGDSTLFQIVALASFIETGSDLYAHNLVAYFDDDAEVAQWLAQKIHGALANHIDDIVEPEGEGTIQQPPPPHCVY